MRFGTRKRLEEQRGGGQNHTHILRGDGAWMRVSEFKYLREKVDEQHIYRVRFLVRLP